jgi:hypothetical protein
MADYLISTVAPTSLNAAAIFSQLPWKRLPCCAWERRRQVLRLFEDEAGQLAHNLDDLDLLGTDFLEYGVELGLCFHGFSGGGGAGNGDGGGGGGYAEFLFESLNELGKLQYGHGLDIGDQLLFIHGTSPFCTFFLIVSLSPKTLGFSGFQ